MNQKQNIKLNRQVPDWHKAKSHEQKDHQQRPTVIQINDKKLCFCLIWRVNWVDIFFMRKYLYHC